MAQIFQRSTNTIARVSIYGAVIFIVLLGYAVDGDWQEYKYLEFSKHTYFKCTLMVG